MKQKCVMLKIKEKSCHAKNWELCHAKKIERKSDAMLKTGNGVMLKNQKEKWH